MRRKIIWLILSYVMVLSLLVASCTPTVTEEEGEEAAPPAAITGLVAADAYDGRVNLWWDKSTAKDFDHYDIYVSKAEIADASGMTSVHQITDIATNTYQVTGLEDGAKYYFAVTAVDKSGNEDTLVTCVSATPTPSPAFIPEASIPIIDAHSQVCPENLEKVIKLMDQGGVACTILSSGMTSTIGIVTHEELVSFASNYPGRIIPAVRTKVKGHENYYELLEKQVNMDQYGAMAEVLMYHDALKVGTVNVPIITAHPSDKSVQAALNYALDKEWPFIVHIEFVAAGSQRDEFMTELKALLVQYPEHPFVLIHMGQLDHAAVRQLIEAHDNIYFITSSSTSAYAENAPWTNMFDGRNLSADWKQLMIDHPDRFILGFDMVFPWMWGQFYLDEVALWREAIKELPVEVAHAFAHGNAERLWHLPPVE